VIGVGINVLPRVIEGTSTPLAALRDWQPQASAPDTLLRVIPQLVATALGFAGSGFAPLLPRFLARDVLRGRPVRTSDGLEGVAAGVDAGGALLVHTAQGTQAIHSSEVSVRPVPASPPAS
jgi:BirA family biotin operon repressor/biotin-[acetyl-CoA-carboxylase] ligase